MFQFATDPARCSGGSKSSGYKGLLACLLQVRCINSKAAGPGAVSGGFASRILFPRASAADRALLATTLSAVIATGGRDPRGSNPEWTNNLFHRQLDGCRARIPCWTKPKIALTGGNHAPAAKPAIPPRRYRVAGGGARDIARSGAARRPGSRHLCARVSRDDFAGMVRPVGRAAADHPVRRALRAARCAGARLSRYQNGPGTRRIMERKRRRADL